MVSEAANRRLPLRVGVRLPEELHVLRLSTILSAPRRFYSRA
jgi:hypothetical protein